MKTQHTLKKIKEQNLNNKQNQITKNKTWASIN
jgi:hypothetical protein